MCAEVGHEYIWVGLEPLQPDPGLLHIFLSQAVQLCDFSFIYLFTFKIVNQKWGVRRDLLGSQVMCATFQQMGQVGSSFLLDKLPGSAANPLGSSVWPMCVTWLGGGRSPLLQLGHASRAPEDHGREIGQWDAPHPHWAMRRERDLHPAPPARQKKKRGKKVCNY